MSNWALGNLVEDTFVAYLKDKVRDNMKVYAAWDGQALQFPCVVVRHTRMEPVSKEAGWHKYRSIPLEISVKAEMAPSVDDNAVAIRTARELCAESFSSVMSALVDYPVEQQTPTTLLALIQLAAVQGVAFSMALVGETVPNTEDGAHGRLYTNTISVETIAEQGNQGA